MNIINFYLCTLCRYFEWVAEIQRLLHHWHNKFINQKVSIDEIVLYTTNQEKLRKIGDTLLVSSMVFDSNTLSNIERAFFEECENLNALLLKYIPNHPDANWCLLSFLLEDHGIHFPQEVHDFLHNKVHFPGTRYNCSELATASCPSGITGKFRPGHNISFKLHKNVTLQELTNIVHCIRTFQQPLLQYMDSFIFFHLKKSAVFQKCLKHFKQAILPSTHDASVMPSLSPEQSPSSHLPMHHLVNALRQADIMMNKIVTGEFNYLETIGEDLEQNLMEIIKEFDIMSQCYKMETDMTGVDSIRGGIKSMLELLQYVPHVENIRSVLEQYQFDKCLNDPQFDELTSILQKLQTKEEMSKITPVVASEMMKRVKQILCFKDSTHSECLDIFPAIARSAKFYQFMKDKQFYGQQGQVIFLQQYNLITAQLQHEQYDETVLNHLRAAFVVISPFMDTETNLSELMKKVTELNAPNVLKQLRTVNTNLNLIKLWFSKAEVIFPTL